MKKRTDKAEKATAKRQRKPDARSVPAEVEKEFQDSLDKYIGDWKQAIKTHIREYDKGKRGRRTESKEDPAWFERKAAELKAELEKLPADRQEQLRRELEDEGDRKQ